MSPSSRDTWRIYALRALRAFGFGYLAVLLPLYLARFGFGAAAVGGYLSLATLGGLLLNLLVARRADHRGRRRALALASGLYALAGTLLALAQGPLVLLLAAVCGTVPPGGNGLFSSVEQGMLAGTPGTAGHPSSPSTALWAPARRPPAPWPPPCPMCWAHTASAPSPPSA